MSAWRLQTSESGLAPWYAGRAEGVGGRGVRSLYGTAVYDSIAWQRTSRPEAMATSRGIVPEAWQRGEREEGMPRVTKGGEDAMCMPHDHGQ